MMTIEATPVDKILKFDAADLEIRAQMDGGAMKIRVMKCGTCVHQLTIDDAAKPLEHAWIADMFAREDRVALSVLTNEADDYISSLDINQG